MGGKETSGSADSPLRDPRPPRAPIPRPPFLHWLAQSDWGKRVQRWSTTSSVVDWLYLIGAGAVALLAACILGSA